METHSLSLPAALDGPETERSRQNRMEASGSGLPQLPAPGLLEGRSQLAVSLVTDVAGMLVESGEWERKFKGGHLFCSVCTVTSADLRILCGRSGVSEWWSNGEISQW